MGEEERNCQLLFEYLRSILYDKNVKELNIRELDEPFQKLGMGMKFLDRAVKEMKDYSAALSKGDLSGYTPPRDNLLCENLKNIHANLNHLTWQAKQVAKGDYSQTVSYLGEFSEAFNTMTRQLQEREGYLKEAAASEKAHAEKAESDNQRLKDREEQLKAEASRDALTEIGNRGFFLEEAGKLLKSGETFSLCYCDLDHLKFVNDNFGHAEGDWYIRFFVGVMQKHIRKEDIFARIGGDEFCIVLKDCTEEAARERLTEAYLEFCSDATGNYPKSFSYGVVEITGDHQETDIKTIIKSADEAMYRQKKDHYEKK